MIVLRYTTSQELKYMLNGEIHKLGTECYGENLSNTHKYKKGIKYLHFFKKGSSLKYIHRILNKKDVYICKFDIPLPILIKGVGVGTYEAKRGYDMVRLTEFAIDARKFKKEWIVEFKPFCQEVNNIQTK